MSENGEQSAFKIHLQDIKPGGLNVSGLIEASDIGDVQHNVMIFTEPFRLALKVERFDKTLVADTTVHGHFTADCSYCLEPIDRDWDNEFTIELELDPDVEEVDLAEEARQEILLCLPGGVNCVEDCKGLCPACGINRNKKTCTCVIETEEQSTGLDIKDL